MTIIVNQQSPGTAQLTFLRLTQLLVQKCGMSGTGPVSVVNQTGELLRAVNWINEAWINIQQSRDDWDWMRAPISFKTAPGQATYSQQQCGITDLAEWLMNSEYCSFRLYNESEGVGSEIHLSYMPYESWRNLYQYGSNRITYSRPMAITITPDQSIGLGQTPDSTDYVIVGEYFRTPSYFVNNTDVPGMPDRFHMAIVYQAMIYYAMYEEDDYLRQMAEREYNKIMGRMEKAQLPEVTFGGALA